MPPGRGPGLRLATHNINGFFYSGPPAVQGWAGSRPQRTKIHDLLYLWGACLRLDIVCVQETHVSLNDFSDRNQEALEDALSLAAADLLVPPYTCFWDHGPTGRQGVAILVRTSLLTPDGLRLGAAEGGADGRRLLLPIRWAGHSFCLLNLYMPNSEQSAFLASTVLPWLALHANPASPAVFVGDLNMTFAPGVLDWLPGFGEGGDRLAAGGRQRHIPDYLDAPAHTLLGACTAAGLHDTFRHKHPLTRTFSCIHHSRCRLLDRIFASASLLPYLESCSVDFRTVSDHRPVIMCLRPAAFRAPHAPPPHPRLRLDFARHPHLRTALTEWGELMLAAVPRDPAAIIDWWAESFKPALKAQVRALNAQALQLRQGRGDTNLQTADAELCAAFAAFEAQAGTTAESVRRVTTAKAAYVRALAALTDPLAAKAQFAWLHEHERVGRQMKGVLAKPRSAYEITCLRTPAGVLLTEPKAIASTLVQHYASISAAPDPSPAHGPAAASVLAAVRAHGSSVAPEQAASAGAPRVKEQEVRAALAGMGRGRAPGPDGIPAHVWRLGAAPFVLLLVALFSAIGTVHSTPAAFTHGIVVPIFKGGDSVLTASASYRPITLLNTDYRTLARVLCARFTTAMEGAVPLEQTAFLPGRMIGESIHFMQLLPAALRAQARSRSAATPDAAVVAFLDFAKAFDTVDRGFLFEIMRAVGMGDSVHWARTLLADCQAVCVANGAASEPQLWTAGVRQGCPLSPPLYLFVAWALTAWLHAQPGVGVHVAGARHVCSQFADDTKALLASLEAATVQPFVDCMGTFGDATGQRLNVGKCSLMRVGALGPGPVPETVCGMTVVTRQVALGVVCSNDDAPPPPAYWAAKLEGVRKAFGRLSRLRLSTMGRGMAASSYGVSKLLYHAEFMGPLPPCAAEALATMSKGLVDRDQGPRMPGAPAAPHVPPGIHSVLLTGSPSAGGFGLLAWQQHIIARHAVWACRLLTFLALEGRRGGTAGLPHLTARREKLEARLADQDRPLPPVSRAKLTKELSMLNDACHRCSPWLLLAGAVLRAHRPAYQPAFSLLDMAAQAPSPHLAVPGPESALPPALRRIVGALRALGAPLADPARPGPAVGPWVAAAPIWGNPLLALERPQRGLPPPAARPWAAQQQVVQWVREWGDRGFGALATPALVHVSSLRDLRARAVAPAWQELTRMGGDGLWHALWGERMVDNALMLTLNYYTPHACLAGVDALWSALPAGWRAVAADPALPPPSACLQQDAVARIVDSLAWGAPHPPPAGARPVGRRPCVPLLGGSTVKAITTLLTWGVQLRRHAAWQRYAEAAMAPHLATGVGGGAEAATGAGAGAAAGVGAAAGARAAAGAGAAAGAAAAAVAAPHAPPRAQQPLRDQRRRLAAQGRLAMLDPPGPPPVVQPPAGPQVEPQAEPVQLTADAVVPWVGSQLRAVWSLPWHNTAKDTLWRLTVQGVPWAGGHGLVPNRACGCGWMHPPDLPASERAAAWQEHCFWSCPIARAVVAEVQRGVPVLGGRLHRSHVWLLSPPADHILLEVWHVVCLAALSAMRFGMRVLYAKQRTAAEEEEARRLGQEGQGGLRQAALEELWFGAAQAELLAPAGAGVAEMASRRAAAEFWAQLGEFVSVHDGRGTWAAAKGLPDTHAFIAGRQGGVGGLRLRLPH